MRNFSKNKFLLCFRPVVHIDAMLESKISTHHSATCPFSCIPISDKHSMIKSSETKPVFFNQVSPKRTISRVIKAVFYETILKRKSHHKNRCGHDPFGSKHSYSNYKETKTPQSPLSTSSSHGSASPSSVSSSQSKNMSSYYSNKEKEANGGGQLEKQRKFEWCGIYLVLLSLVFTVFLGKFFGIILTSTWLYFFSVWNSSYHCQKRLPSYQKQKHGLQGKHRGHYGKCATRELP